ncbi:hypothetical protein HDA32_003118 [Spinactinospora alkalitolerans]|uniref:Tn3 transposase DDE domain-containing protein n=1 Tax=Spinactinospora alkalitolerans TaxID=687207 RepID=A0A852TVN7_9ACTN|nr:Tn3 family transposase [Spinactinospora alkalitolerans]NYE47998.1 hypothetical protein [Spinactinospora alkalitolerans]
MSGCSGTAPSERIKPPEKSRIERTVRAGLSRAEEEMTARVADRIGPDALERMSALIGQASDYPDQMVKYATAIRSGTASTEAILRRFTRNAPHPAYAAMLEAGPVWTGQRVALTDSGITRAVLAIGRAGSKENAAVVERVFDQ